MAIKGKSRSRARGKQVSRPPRREPVQVKPAFFKRRWVQISVAALAGAAAVLLVFWVIRGLHSDKAKNDKQAADAKRLVAAHKWETALGGALTPIATRSQSGTTPSLFLTFGPTLTSLASGKPAKGAAASIKQVTDGVSTATAALARFNGPNTLKDQGFTAAEITSFISAQDLINGSLTMYAKAADVAKSALAAKGDVRKQLTAAATADQASAVDLFSKGWNAFLEALLEAGVNLSRPSPGGGAGAPSP